MASATNTKLRNKHEQHRAGGLTLKILSVNLIVPVILIIGLFYMQDYQSSLVKREQETVELHARLFAATLEESARTTPLTKSHGQRILDDLTRLTPDQAYLTLNPTSETKLIEEKEGTIKSSAPINFKGKILGTVHVTRTEELIDASMNRLRFGVISLFLSVLSITILISVYLSGIIGSPLQKLARAAELIRCDKSRRTVIPALGHRRDEIGALALALQDMMDTLWERMDSIESFAADVAHELKNPLTSLRSAAETLAKIEDKDKRAQLMDIIQHDISRLDRLITDISQASRLDAALGREELHRVVLCDLLQQLTENLPHKKDIKIHLSCDEGTPVYVLGNESRLVQVFENLITNAISFSPPNSTVEIAIHPEDKTIRTTVTDHGPGIPESRLEKIFERFYTERPGHEEYGRHSGLGLSIARQIIKAHGGTITARNMTDDGGAITGSCFTVILNQS